MTDDRQAVIAALKAAGAVSGTNTFLSTAEVADATGLPEEQGEKRTDRAPIWRGEASSERPVRSAPSVAARGMRLVDVHPIIAFGQFIPDKDDERRSESTGCGETLRG